MDARDQQALEDLAFECRLDPVRWVLSAYPWCEGGTPLAATRGPRQWQLRYLQSLRDELVLKQKSKNRVIRRSVSSGHGIGKSALIGMLCSWAMSTRPDTRIILTAGTESQLKTKTWPEITKWFEMSATRPWFNVEETSITSVDPKHHRRWEMNRVTWNIARTEAFQGAHNEGNRLVIIYDEASQIDDRIWEVTEGALTDENTEILWLVFGNPTRTEGAFHRSHHGASKQWSPIRIYSREVEGVNKEQLDAWLEEHGFDSDFYRVRARGEFPRASELQFIPNDFVFNAQKREPQVDHTDPLIMALDVSRGGADRSVFYFRRGYDARSISPIVIPGSEVRDSTRLIAKAAQLCDQFKPDYVFVDATGGSVGGPVADSLRKLGYQVTDVQFSAKSPVREYANMRGYMWGRLRDALEHQLAIPRNSDLETDLTLPQFTHDKQDRVLLESKADMKARGYASPDLGDALAMTFAMPVRKRTRFEGAFTGPVRKANMAESFMQRVNGKNEKLRKARR